MPVHNHGPEEGAGLSCNEFRLPDGSLRGACLMSDDIPTMVCAGDGCKKTILDTFEGRNQAWRDGWFITKWGASAYCPDDLPIWVPDHFKRKDSKENN
ncbi:hypothetical protein [Streptomyces phage Psst1]|nr:hypothetical protein [Streptomyces phage Psst1]WPJ30674.1 hypothetical protein [Streptomyces phage Psst2]